MVDEADDSGMIQPLSLPQKRGGKNNKKKQNRKQFRQSLTQGINQDIEGLEAALFKNMNQLFGAIYYT